MKRRYHFVQVTTLEERLADDARQSREKAKTLPAGIERESLLRKAKLDETAIHIIEWLNSGELKSPT